MFALSSAVIASKHLCGFKRIYGSMNLIVALAFLSFTEVSLAQSFPKVVPGEYIIKYKMDIGRSNAIGKIQSKVNLKAAFPEMNMLHMAVKPGQEAVIDELRKDKDVLFVEPNYILEKLVDDNTAGKVLNTLSLDQVYSQSSTSFTQNYSNVKVDQAWTLSSAYDSSNRPIVAILDTGLDKQHTVIQASQALWVNTKEIPGNGVDDDQNGYVDDVNGWNFVSNTSSFADDEGHGTHVAGIVIGAGMDIFSAQLDVSKIRIMPLKFLDSQGAGSTANAIKAIYYAVNNGAKVINNSWGGPGYSSSLLEALTFAYNHQVLIVSAAGNSAKNNDTNEMFPANYGVPSNISVAATTDSDRLATFSNFGANLVHVASPGVYIYSTLPGNIFGSMSGTSMAAPFVAGIAALALREAPSLTGYQMKNLIISSAFSLSALRGIVQSGARVDAYSLLSQVKSNQYLAASQPDYKPVYSEERSLASESEPSQESTSKGGCGAISTSAFIGKGQSFWNSGNGGASALAVMALMAFPLLVYFGLRLRSRRKDYRRQHDRFMMSSDIRVKVGDKELVGHMRTISLGGLSFNAEEMLDKGGSVTIKIKGPDNKEIDVEGRVVWSEANHSYGVKFEETRLSLSETILNWTQKLVKADN